MVIAPKSGIRVKQEEISAVLKPHQKDAVMWAAEGGRRAIFAAFGYVRWNLGGAAWRRN